MIFDVEVKTGSLIMSMCFETSRHKLDGNQISALKKTWTSNGRIDRGSITIPVPAFLWTIVLVYKGIRYLSQHIPNAIHRKDKAECFSVEDQSHSQRRVRFEGTNAGLLSPCLGVAAGASQERRPAAPQKFEWVKLKYVGTYE